MTSHCSHIAIFAALAFLLSACGTAKTDEPTAMPAASAPTAAPVGQPQRSPTESAAPTPKAVAPRPPLAQSATMTAPPVPVAVGDFTNEPALKDVFFDPGQTGMGRTGAAVIRNNARWMVENPGYLILIEGHSDHKGTRESNREAGEQRAAAAANALVKAGVPGTRLWTVSHGSERPVCAERTDACAARNRRVHFRTQKQ
jgi:peptidoglycan-associated lipoprotein